MIEHAKSTARLVLITFVLTFATARILVYLIMARTLPDLFLFVGGTHVHHLNYGIFLLAGVGAVLLFARPTGRWLTATAHGYGIGLALTFDEFGMWLHLGGGYWQRASFDAVILVAAILSLVAFMPGRQSWTRRYLLWALVVLLVSGLFFWRFFKVLEALGHRVAPRFEQLEKTAPP